MRTVLVLLAAALALTAADPITGKWDFVLDTPGGERRATPTFQLDGEKVTGKWENSDVQGTFVDGKLNLAFPFTSSEGGFSAALKIEGKLDGDTIAGKWEFAEYGGTFKATRAK